MNKNDREAARVELALSIPNEVIGPMLVQIAANGGKEAICLVCANKSGTMLSIVDKDRICAVFGVPRSHIFKNRHVPFVIVDRHGTTVIHIEEPVQLNAPGGDA